jgi:predicted transporter
MNLWKKAAVSIAATSIVLAPVAASAAPALDAARAASVTEGQNELEGASWIAIVLGLAIIGGGIWLLVDDDGDDDPVSP